MIEYIKGEIVELTPARMILECAGIGYELNISLNTYTFYNGKPTGKIYVYEVIREDAHLLFGFAGKDERELFLMLTSVSGVGPNTARMILSSLSPSELIRVIADKNETALTSVKGISYHTKYQMNRSSQLAKSNKTAILFSSWHIYCCLCYKPLINFLK